MIPLVKDFLNKAYNDTDYALAKDLLNDVKTNFEEARNMGQDEMKRAFETNRRYYEELEKVGEKIRKRLT